MVLRQQQSPGEQDEAIKGGGELAGAGAADLVGGCGSDSEDGGVHVDEEQLIDGNPSESAMSTSVCLPSAKRDGEPKLLCTTSFVTHVLLII